MFRVRDFAFALAGYTGFGVGYIGYMTFVIALLREQGSSSSAITTFYALLGLAVIASSRIWAGLLDRHRNGQALARLNALLGLAAIVPALTSWPPLVIASGLLFGGVFLSVVASTTALVQRVHHRVRCRADPGADGGGLHCGRIERRTRLARRPGVFGRGAVDRCGIGAAPARTLIGCAQ